MSPKNSIGIINFAPSWTNYVIYGQLRYIRSKIEKLVFTISIAYIGLILKQIQIIIQQKVTWGH